jgi:hypothetical protein
LQDAKNSVSEEFDSDDEQGQKYKKRKTLLVVNDVCTCNKLVCLILARIFILVYYLGNIREKRQRQREILLKEAFIEYR